MIDQQLILDVHGEIVIDNFAGGGGASTGIELALGRHVDVAINHDPQAVAMHRANHPQTEHHCESVWDVDPRAGHLSAMEKIRLRERLHAYPRARTSQQVLKAEGDSPDATDRDCSANASPVGGPMGFGQPAAAGPDGMA